LNFERQAIDLVGDDVRYALYFSPQKGTPLWRFGSHWLGRDSVSGMSLAPFPMKGVKPDRVREITATPRIYGFHATLKAPFHLPRKTTLDKLDEALETFVMDQKPFKVPALEMCVIDGFIALRPSGPCPELNDFAADCVRTFDPFRSPPSPEEWEKRLCADLTPRQTELLKQWGYPYVMDEYRFHMTLTDHLPTVERETVMASLFNQTQDTLDREDWIFDTLTLMRQRASKKTFEVVKGYPFKLGL